MVKQFIPIIYHSIKNPIYFKVQIFTCFCFLTLKFIICKKKLYMKVKNKEEPKYRDSFWYPILCKFFKTVFWSMFSSEVMSREAICQPTSIFFTCHRLFSTISRKGRGSTLTSKFPEQTNSDTGV